LGTGSRLFGEAQGSSKKRCCERRNQADCRESALPSAFPDHIAAWRILLGKEGVDGSSPSEGLPKVPANRHFVVVYSANTRTHSGHICGTRDARRRLASSSDTSVTRLVDTLTREITRKETTSVATVGEILTPSQRERVSSRSRPTGRPLRAHFRCHRSPANPDLDDPSQPECSLHAPGPSVQRFGDQCVP
jgi:hypothetical protein